MGEFHFMNLVIIAIACGVIALLYGILTSQQVLRASPGNQRMVEVAGAIQEGASAYLKRQPSEDRADGMVTYTWSIQNASNVDYHYLVAGGVMPGLSLSVSAIRK